MTGMRLENVVWDARDPHRLGGFWAAALGAEVITDEPDLVEARLQLSDDVFLDLCFPRVTAPAAPPARLRLDLAGGPDLVDDTDPEGNAFRVVEHSGTGPIAALRLDSADPDRDAAFWSAVTGWIPEGNATLRHPTGVGPRLELRREAEPKNRKSRLHLDVRRNPGDDDVVERIVGLGATHLANPPEHPWLLFLDPSGNEFCVLDAQS